MSCTRSRYVGPMLMSGAFVYVDTFIVFNSINSFCLLFRCRILNDDSQDDTINNCEESTEYKEMFKQALDDFRAIGFIHEVNVLIF